MSLVLDNSVVCAWLFENQATQYSEAVALRLGHQRAIAPALLPLEYTNVLRMACKRGRLDAHGAQQAIGLLCRLPIDIDDRPVDPALVFALALRHDLTRHDAAYLELALRLQRPIATQDAELADAARIAGVGVLRL